MNHLDSVQELRELHYKHPDVIAAGPLILELHLMYIRERQNRDIGWYASESGDKELNKKKYRGKWVYIGWESVAGYGITPRKASEMAIRNTNTDPIEMLCIKIPKKKSNLL